MPGKDTNIGAKRARETREALGLDAAAPLKCVLRTAEERAGVPVIIARLPSGVAGCCWRDGERALLWVNGAQPLPRQRFTVAHELGHVRCRHAGALPVDAVAVLAGDTRDPREVQANAFAAELLAPRAGVEAMVDGEPDLETVVRIATRFGISAVAALYRLSTLRLTARYDRLRREIEEGLHERVAAYVGAPELDDGLARIAEHPRIPAALAGSALAAALTGAASVPAAAGAAGAEPGTLAAALAMVAR